jgi:hypothetical protein
VLDPRIYRAAFLPILFVLVLVGFSLRDQPRGAGTALAPDAFDQAAAFAQLERLAEAAPDRRPGSPGDRLVAQRVEQTLTANGFRAAVRRATGETIDGERELTTVVGERTGFSSRRVLVVAQRDAVGVGAEAQLSGTAALLELSRVLGGRTLDRTLVLASTSGGRSAIEALAENPGGPVDAVIVLGDLAGTDLVRPYVVPWADDARIAPLQLRRTVEAAVQRETGARAGGIAPALQFTRLAFPLTLSDQGPFNTRGIPAVLLSAGGERPPAADQEVSEERLGGFGRAALRSMTALDRGADVPGASPYILIERKLLPQWPVRLLGLALILPVLIAAIDGFARVRRRQQRVGRWFGWIAACALPFVLAVLLCRALAATGLLDVVPPGPVPAEAIPRDGTALAALGSVLVMLALGWLGLRPLVLRYLVGRGDAGSPGAAAAVMLVLVAIALVVWVLNPYTALLLVPALHLWLLMVAPEVRLHPLARIALFALGFLPALLVAYAYARQFALDPLELAWMGLLLVAGGGVGLPAALGWAIVLGCAAGVLAIIVRTAGGGPDSEAAITVRGPSTYAGPGSLGGTRSALRK